MKNIKFENGIIKCICPDCNAITNFNYRDDKREFGYVIINKSHVFEGHTYSRVIYKLYSCSGCGRGGVAKINCDNKASNGEVEDFYPIGLEKAKLPAIVPAEIISELREAEVCASAGAFRAGSAMLRSVLEKIFIENGYNEDGLFNKIEAAKSDRVITDSRAKKAHEDVRVLGNDILHEQWKSVSPDDFNTAYYYCQRIIEDFYDDRETVETLLKSVGRLKN